MKLRVLLPTLVSLATCGTSWAQSSMQDLRNIAPALDRYTEERLISEVWKRPDLSPRDRALPPASPTLLPLDEAAEAARAARVQQQFGDVAPGLVQYTTDVLFRDLWLRPDLAPRDRGLITVSALIASGQVAQVTYHLNRAMDHGLTQGQAGEVITHLAFYAGWPNAFSALPVAKDVFEKRPK